MSLPTARRPAIALVALWVALGAVHALWLSRDTRPPSWDPANHLLSEVRYRNALGDLASGRTAPLAAARALLRVDDHYPPLAPLAAAVAAAPFPPRSDAATLVLAMLALAILLFAVYRIGAILFSPEAGAIAAAAAATFPLVAGQSRQFMLDLPDAAMTSLAILALLSTDAFRRLGPALLFGAALGLALLTKWTCAFFVALPLAAALASAGRAPDARRRLATAGAALLLGAAIAAPWYLAHLWTLARDTTKFAYAVGVREGDPPVWTARSLLYYPRALPYAATGAWTAAFAAGALVALLRDRRRSTVPLLWLLGGGAILTLIRNKDVRYVIPMLPAVALLAAAGLTRLRWPRLRVAAAGALAAAGLVAAWRRDPPRAERWPVAEAVSWIETASAGNPAPRLRIVPDLPSFERHAFELESEARRFRLDVGTWFRFPAFTDFVLTKSGAQGERPEPAAIMADIGSPASTFQALFRPRWSSPLPDGSVATIWARDPEPVPASGAEVSAALEAALRRVVASWASDVEGLSVAIEASDGEARRGRFARVSIALAAARARAKPGAAAALAVHDAALDARGLAIDAPALLRDGTIRVLALAEAVPRISVDDAAATAWLAARNPRARISLRFTGGRIEAAGRWGRWPAVQIAVRPSLVPPGNVGWRVERFRIGALALPGALVEALFSGNNPVLKPMPCRVRLDSLEIARGVLSVNGR